MTLKPSQHRLAVLVTDGLTNRQIANVLGFKREQSVKNHLHTLYDKAGVWSRLELALWYIAHFEEGKP